MFFKEKIEDKFLIKISALLVHAAKIDQNFTKDEQLIIEKTLLKLGANENKLNQIIEKSKILEENSNQILDFTREIKNLSTKEKINIVESLWKVVYSNKNADIYETNLMRRLAGLLYIDNKTMGDIKDKIKNQNL